VARLGASTGQAEPAAELIGAATAVREATGMARSPAETAYLEPTVCALRAALGDPGFAAAEATGRAMPQAEAVAAAQALATLPSEPAATSPAEAAHGLTPREREVLRLLAAGETNRAIADRLFISPATVARHVSNLYGKLGLDSRAKAAAYALRHGLA